MTFVHKSITSKDMNTYPEQINTKIIIEDKEIILINKYLTPRLTKLERNNELGRFEAWTSANNVDVIAMGDFNTPVYSDDHLPSFKTRLLDKILANKYVAKSLKYIPTPSDHKILIADMEYSIDISLPT